MNVHFEKPTHCPKCGYQIIWTEMVLEENIDGIKTYTPIEKGFCPTCGSVSQSIQYNFLLKVIENNTGKSTILQQGETFSSVYSLIPVYENIFSSLIGNFSLQILSKVHLDKQIKIEYRIIFETNIEYIDIEKKLN